MVKLKNDKGSGMGGLQAEKRGSRKEFFHARLYASAPWQLG